MSLTAALFLGGRSTRMGRDKAMLEIGGEPLWWRQWQKVCALHPTRLLLSARAGQEVPAPPPPARVVRDADGDIGPLAGLLACLREIQLDGPGARLLVLGIDLPRMPAAFLQDLIYASDPGCGAVARSGDVYEAMAAVYPAELLEVASRRARLGHLSLQGLIREGVERGLMDELPARDWPCEIFFNLNTPEDLARLEP